ncbi:hypothetical protein GCK32_004896 [Trichostrongylus colubriformis]|uniref:Uncharacterized protein n=1 Tax=Trichostrongylus colubriformis TaxID=6319 RepID=A0AAN8J3N1_TRICO
MYTVSSRDNERYCLSVLRKTCFEDLRTVDGVTLAKVAKRAGFVERVSDDYINRGFDSEHAVTHAYFDSLDRMVLMGRDLREILYPPVPKRLVEPALPVDYVEHERNGLLNHGSLSISV